MSTKSNNFLQNNKLEKLAEVIDSFVTAYNFSKTKKLNFTHFPTVNHRCIVPIGYCLEENGQQLWFRGDVYYEQFANPRDNHHVYKEIEFKLTKVVIIF